MLEVIPISRPNIEWSRFLSTVMGFLGRCPTRTLDEVGYPIGDYKSFLVMLNDLVWPGMSVEVAMQTCREACRHLSFTFMVCGNLEDLIEISARSSAAMIVGRQSGGMRTAILTASLWEWMTAIEGYCDRMATVEARRFYNTIIVYFQQVGLSDLWSLKDRVIQSDGTFILEDL